MSEQGVVLPDGAKSLLTPEGERCVLELIQGIEGNIMALEAIAGTYIARRVLARMVGLHGIKAEVSEPQPEPQGIFAAVRAAHAESEDR